VSAARILAQGSRDFHRSNRASQRHHGPPGPIIRGLALSAEASSPRGNAGSVPISIRIATCPKFQDESCPVIVATDCGDRMGLRMADLPILDLLFFAAGRPGIVQQGVPAWQRSCRVSYAIHGRPPEGDFKPPQAADSAPYHAAIHVSASSRVSKRWTSITGDAGTRLHEQERPQVSGGIASKGKETRPRGSDRHLWKP